MKTDRSWSLDMKPVYQDYDPYYDGANYWFYDSTIKYMRVAIKSGGREVLVLHAARPEPPHMNPDEDFIFTMSRMVDPYNNPDNLDLNPLKQLLDDAELGRRLREAGLELKQ